MKSSFSKIRFQAILPTLFLFTVPSVQAEDFRNPDEFRRSILSGRVNRVLEIRVEALRGCARTMGEALQVDAVSQALREASSSALSNTDRLLRSLDAYRMSVQIKRSHSGCAEKLREADQILFEEERVKFRSARVGAHLISLNPAGLSPLDYLFIQLDPWCASVTSANFDGSHDGNPCFAGERPILTGLRDTENKRGQTFYAAGADVDFFLSNLARRVESKSQAIDFTELFRPGTEKRRIFSIMAYLYSAGTSELGWVDGFGEVFWRASLDQGSSAQGALGEYLTWLNRKDQFVALRAKFRQDRLAIYLFGKSVKNWNHHEFISALLSCDYQSSGEGLLARTVPEALGLVYEGKDFVSHLKEKMGIESSFDNFITDVTRHQRGGYLGRTTCSL